MSVLFNQFDCFLDDLTSGIHNFNAQSFFVFLTNQQPVRTNKIKSEIAEITPGFGYVSMGSQMIMSKHDVMGVVTVFGTNVQFTAQGGQIGPFQYAVLFNHTSSNDSLIGWWDYGVTLVLNATEAFTVVTNPSLGLFELERTS